MTTACRLIVLTAWLLVLITPPARASLTLTWQEIDPTPYIAIERGSSETTMAPLNEQPPGTTQWVDLAATGAGTYCYRVRATWDRVVFSPYSNTACVTILAPDTTAPVLTLPGNITVAAADQAGVYVTFQVYAADVDDAVTALICTPPSGAKFPIQVTTVICTATDTHSNSASGSFTVTVTPPQDLIRPAIIITAPIGPYVARHTRVQVDATATDDIGMRSLTLAVGVHGHPPTAICTITGTTATLDASCGWNVPASPGRTYDIVASAIDAAGNTATRSLQVTAR